MNPLTRWREDEPVYYTSPSIWNKLAQPQEADTVGILAQVIAEGTAEQLAAAEMVVASSGATTGFEAIEIIDSKSMTTAMETANKVVSAYQAPNK